VNPPNMMMYSKAGKPRASMLHSSFFWRAHGSLVTNLFEFLFAAAAKDCDAGIYGRLSVGRRQPGWRVGLPGNTNGNQKEPIYGASS
jgi:hypothetical protein